MIPLLRQLQNYASHRRQETFRFSKFISAIAASILSPPTKREGLASFALIAICDFLIKSSTSQPSGLTTKPLLSDDMTFTVIISFTFLLFFVLFLCVLDQTCILFHSYIWRILLYFELLLSALLLPNVHAFASSTRRP